MSWVPVVAHAALSLLSRNGNNYNDEEARRAREAAEEARRQTAEMKTQADALQQQVNNYEREQEKLRNQLELEVARRAEQDEKHQETLNQLREENEAARAQHKEEMKEFQQKALSSEKRMIIARRKDLERERNRMDHAYQAIHGEMEEMQKQVHLENVKLQQFGPELDDPSIKRIVLLGLTGDGKSTLANRLAGDTSEDADQGPFKTSGSVLSETQKVVKVVNEMFGVKISVVDTPGISDSSGRGRDRQHITNLVAYLRGCGGVNQFLILKSKANPRLSDVYMGMLRELEDALGAEFWNFVTIVLTRVESRRDFRDFPTYKAELCQQLSEKFGVSGIDGIGIGLDDYEDVLREIVTRIVPDHKFICENLVSPLEQLEAQLEQKKEEVVESKKELDVMDVKIDELSKSLRDVEQQLAQLAGEEN